MSGLNGKREAHARGTKDAAPARRRPGEDEVWEGKSFEEELFIDLRKFFLSGGGEELCSHRAENAVVAGSMLGECFDERVGHQLGVSSISHQRAEEVGEFVRGLIIETESDANAGGKGQQLGLVKQLE